MTPHETNEDERHDSGSRLVPSRDLITGGFSKNADFISYVLTGLLIGVVLDWAFGTRPLMIIIWAILGIAVGFYRLWKASEELEEQAKGRGHGV